MFRHLLVFAALLVICARARADVFVSTVLNLADFTITPSLGTVQIQSGLFALVNASAADNLGNSDAASGFNIDGPASTSTSPILAPYSSASASADAYTLTTSSASGVNIPGTLVATVLPTSTDGNSQLGPFFSGVFDIASSTPGANPVNVSFGAVLTGNQYLHTNQQGILADSQVTFSLQLPDYATGSFLFYNNPLSIGSNQTSGSISGTSVNETLSSSAVLLTNTPYQFFAETDAESDGVNTPEPGYFVTLAAGLSLLFVFARRLRRG
jgi:hypothetical protein